MAVFTKYDAPEACTGLDATRQLVGLLFTKIIVNNSSMIPMLHASDSAVRQLYQMPLCLVDTSGGYYPELAVYRPMGSVRASECGHLLVQQTI